MQPTRSTQFGFYCDFDGTISENDMIAQIMMEFVPNEAQPVIERVVGKQISIQEGVESMFGFIPSKEFAEVQRFAVETTRMRKGFPEFVAYCKAHDWPLTVVSGGFDFFVYAALQPFMDDIEVYCNHIDASGEFLKVIWTVPCEDPCEGGCGLCKPTVIRRNASLQLTNVVIGDGVTDLQAARLADYVFARDKLLAECRSTSTPHAPFDTFFDITTQLSNPNSEVYRYAK